MDIEASSLMDMAQPSYGIKEPETYKEIVLRTINKCASEMEKELTKGTTKMIEKNGIVIPIVIPDQRKVVENCVKTLYNLLLFTFDKEAFKTFGNIQRKIRDLDKKYYEMYLERETWMPHKKTAHHTLSIPTETPLGGVLIQKKDDERVELYEEMFQELLLLYKRKKELSNKRIASNDAPVDWEKLKEDLKE